MSAELAAVGWSGRVAALFAEAAISDTIPGRIVRIERSAAMVATGHTIVVVPAVASIAVGDWVAVREGDGDPVIAGVLPRWSELTRADPGGAGPQVLVANVDVVLVVAPGDRPRVGRIERELVIAWDSGAVPAVVVTKGDLVDDTVVRALEDRLVGARVIVTSTATGAGLDDVAALIRPDRTAVLLGPSGAGKSSLVNALLGEDRLATGEVREGDRRGRHTTTSRDLIAMPGGGVIIDTPGVRSLGLLGDPDGIEAAFADIEEIAASCRFADCRHMGEPGCAVVDAAASGALDPTRLASYLKLQSESEAQDERNETRARAEAQRRSKAHVAGLRAKTEARDE